MDIFKSKKPFYNALSVKIIGIFLICTTFFNACKKDETLIPNNWAVLGDTVKIASVPLYQINLAILLGGYSQFSKYFKYPITIYKITYHTKYQGADILASGLVCLPQETPASPPIMAIGNGLFFSDKEAPTSFSYPDNFIGYEFVSSVGYVTLIPDMIGFGESKDILFPIYNYECSSTAMIDMVKAANEFIAAKELTTNGKLFLAGYSHGAYVAGATLKAIEETPGINISVTATAMGAGGYNIPSLMGTILNQDSIQTPSYLALIFSSYNSTYQWNRPLTDFFSSPSVNFIPSLIYGEYTRSEIDSQLSNKFDELLNPTFLEKLRANEETQVINAFAENSIHNWKPLSPLRLYHSPTDERIPFSDSQEAYNNMIANGAEHVEFFEIEGNDHFNAVFNFMELVLPWFGTFE